MKPLNKQFAPKSVMPEKVIQFGEGNFLRAFVDWIIWNMDQKCTTSTCRAARTVSP